MHIYFVYMKFTRYSMVYMLKVVVDYILCMILHDTNMLPGWSLDAVLKIVKHFLPISALLLHLKVTGGIRLGN